MYSELSTVELNEPCTQIYEEEEEEEEDVCISGKYRADWLSGNTPQLYLFGTRF
jgi:hypothetical protein